MKAIDFELIEEESKQNESSRFLSGITWSYPKWKNSAILLINTNHFGY